MPRSSAVSQAACSDRRRKPGLLKLHIGLLRSHRLVGHIFHHLAAKLVSPAGGQHADTARGQGDRLNLLEPSALDLNVKAEPVAAVEASGGVEADGSGDGAFKIV